VLHPALLNAPNKSAEIARSPANILKVYAWAPPQSMMLMRTGSPLPSFVTKMKHTVNMIYIANCRFLLYNALNKSAML
jgi:hypothetical protein